MVWVCFFLNCGYWYCFLHVLHIKGKQSKFFSLKIIVCWETAISDLWVLYTKQLSHDEVKGQQELKALLRWRRLRDEVQNSEEELQVLR